MREGLKQKLLQTSACLLCALLAWRYGSELEGTEFSGGRITGPLLDMYDIGLFLFFPAMLVTFFYRRVAAAIAVAACLLCLPLYLYFTAPGPFRWIFRGNYSVPAPAGLVWTKWGVAGILALTLAMYVAVRNVLRPPPT
jgi:hypothetical protein